VQESTQIWTAFHLRRATLLADVAIFNQKDMMVLADLMQSGKVSPVIDRT
jgi:hypothetical protein